MENAVNTNRRRNNVSVESQHFFKHEKEEKRSFLILIYSFKMMINIWFESTANKIHEKNVKNRVQTPPPPPQKKKHQVQIGETTLLS